MKKKYKWISLCIIVLVYLIQVLFAIYRSSVPIAEKIDEKNGIKIKIYQGISFKHGCIPLLGIFINLMDHGNMEIAVNDHVEWHQYDTYSDVDIDKMDIQINDDKVILDFPNLGPVEIKK
jgi:hypothetical protein